jgi:putative transposase
MAVTPKSSWPWVRTLLHSVFDQPDSESVGSQYDRIIEALADNLPKVADHLEAARADLLAFTAFPKAIWRQIWSNNPQVIWSPSGGVLDVRHGVSRSLVVRAGRGYLQSSRWQSLRRDDASCTSHLTGLVA